jgi:hypothetical protein
MPGLPCFIVFAAAASIALMAAGQSFGGGCRRGSANVGVAKLRAETVRRSGNAERMASNSLAGLERKTASSDDFSHLRKHFHHPARSSVFRQ